MKRDSIGVVMNIKFNLHKKNIEKTPKELPDIESFQKSLLKNNVRKIEFILEVQKLTDEISTAISSEFLQARYEETPLINRLKELEKAASRAGTYEEVLEIKTQFNTLVQNVKDERMRSALRQQGINASVVTLKKSE